jgi:Domain of unknown function (DUF5658)
MRFPNRPSWHHPETDRRQGAERRRRVLQALLVGSFRPRRRGHRRQEESGRIVDWHDSRWLAVVMLVLILSTVDAMLTLTLVAQGTAAEANPLMAQLLDGDGLKFALWKLGLTSVGVVTLTALARQRVFGWLRVGTLLYAVLLLYTALIAYEVGMLRVAYSATPFIP